ncbi:MAG: ABC transporter permease subunit, partial [Myxococcota bacterium]
RKTLFVVLTRPVSRAQYVLGRYLGLVAALAGVVLGFSLVFFLMLGYVLAAPTSLDVLALAMAFVEAAVLAAFAMVLSSFSTPSLAAGIGLGFWIAAASTDDLVNLTAKADGPTRFLAGTISYLLPAFARFNFRDAAVHGLAVDPGAVLQTFLYGGLYAAAFVALASLILGRREMT